MLDSFAVTSKFSRTQVIVLRLSIVSAAIAIAVYNFISTCSPYYATTYSGSCVKTLLPSGSQFFYDKFRMTSLSQLDYDGFHPQNCSTYNVAIQESFATKHVPSFKIYMGIRCNDDVNLSVLDFTFQFWHEHYQDILKSAERLKYYKKDPAQPNQPFDTVEFKHNWLYGDDNSLRLFNDGEVLIIDPRDATVDRGLFYTMMDSALDEVKAKPLPGNKDQNKEEMLPLVKMEP
ncbi:hypothetical protein BGZ81_010422 [Podila clonocystis]|nr:hypothetical protein BGZ81_010422 [Podila clonocystis]